MNALKQRHGRSGANPGAKSGRVEGARPAQPGDAVLMSTPLCELGIGMEASFFGAGLIALEQELQRAGVALRPRFYLCTGYGCVVRTANVGLLFTDAVPALRRLARAAGLRVRNRGEILRTLRHETGHAFCYTHRLHETPRFRDLFGVTGDFYDTYPDVWRPTREAFSRVARGDIIGVYAARHADEDFSVCFQTWLENPAGCAAPYARRPRIIEKLAYVAGVVRSRGAHTVASDPSDLDEPVDAVRMTLREWFETVRRQGDYNLFPKGPVA